ncbi:thioredoxin [Alistipes sp.]|uniref:thioredoxin n=1 Tax=Alistipes sp. TaxID=1872444 RepID=UPI003AF09834
MKKSRIGIVSALALLAGAAAPGALRAETQNTKTMKAIELTEAEFKTAIFDYTKNNDWKYEGDLPAVIDFYATWCGPCKMMSPVMETLAGEYEGRVRVYKVDVDKERRLAALFGVRSIPTFIFIPRAGKPQHATGAMGIDDMRKIVDGTLLGK